MISVELSVTTELLNQSLQEGAQPFLPVSSDSMAPLLQQGDEIKVILIRRQELDLGDIIVVSDEHGFLAHRYWSTISSHHTTHLVLRGDRMKTYDPPYSETQLIGLVSARRRKNHTLDLTQGIGRQLHLLLKHLAALAVSPPTTTSPPVKKGPSDIFVEPNNPNRVARWPIFGGLYYLARLITMVVDIINVFQQRIRRS